MHIETWGLTLSNIGGFGDCITYEFILNTVVQARIAVKKRAKVSTEIHRF
jgi:hypothetical protein